MVEKDCMEFLKDGASKVVGISFSPDQFSTEAMRLLVAGNITQNPHEVLYKIGNRYRPIEANKFLAMRRANPEQRNTFIEHVVRILKGPYTNEIIISNQE